MEHQFVVIKLIQRCEFLELQRSEGIAVLSWRSYFKLLKSKVSMAFLHPKCGLRVEKEMECGIPEVYQ